MRHGRSRCLCEGYFISHQRNRTAKYIVHATIQYSIPSELQSSSPKKESKGPMPQVDISKSISLTRSSSLVLVLDTPKGRGIFASTAIPGGTIIETCPVLVLDRQQNIDHIEKTELFHYT